MKLLTTICKDLYLGEHSLLDNKQSLSFIDFIKCNIRCNDIILSDRNLDIFLNALDFIEGNNTSSNLKDFYRALQYYYNDIYDYLNRNAKYITTDYNFIDSTQILSICDKLTVNINLLARELKNYINNKSYEVLYNLDYDILVSSIPMCLLNYKFVYFTTEIMLVKYLCNYNLYLEVI